MSCVSYTAWKMKFSIRDFFSKCDEIRSFFHPCTVTSTDYSYTCIFFYGLKHWHCLKSVQIRSFFWSVIPCIWTKYGDLRTKFLYSVWMRENTDQKNSVFGNFSRSAGYYNEGTHQFTIWWILVSLDDA